MPFFSEDGLIYAKDIDTYNTRASRLKTAIRSKDAHTGDRKFRPYFENRLLPTLQAHVIGPHKQAKISPNWTSNNSECANHILKSATNWKLSDMPKLIDTLYKIVLSETNERCRALRNAGNYKLSTTHQHHLVTIDHWANITQEQRGRREHKFKNDKGRDAQNIIVSTNGQRTIRKSQSAGKKPNQVKRKKAERSRTPSSKRRLIQC